MGSPPVLAGLHWGQREPEKTPPRDPALPSRCILSAVLPCKFRCWFSRAILG
jgi:hypothetical protein